MNNDKKSKKNLAVPDFAAMLATILVTLAESVEAGLIAGIALGILLSLSPRCQTGALAL